MSGRDVRRQERVVTRHQKARHNLRSNVARLERVQPKELSSKPAKCSLPSHNDPNLHLGHVEAAGQGSSVEERMHAAQHARDHRVPGVREEGGGFKGREGVRV
jgi:hypothetical protein